MKKILWLSFLAFFSLPAQAGSSCYAPEHLRAERLIRLHSELMVITVTCRQSSTGQDLSGAYAGFTRRNIGVLHGAEKTLTDFYKVSYGGKGIDRLDTLRTKLANEYGQQSANDSPALFCQQRRDMVVAMLDAPPSSLADEAMRRYADDKTYAPACGGKVSQVSQKANSHTKKANRKTKKPKKAGAV